MAEGTDYEGCWAAVILGPSHLPPEDAAITTPPDDVTRLGLTYMHTWDHEPSQAEKDALTPAEYLDDDELIDGEADG